MPIKYKNKPQSSLVPIGNKAIGEIDVLKYGSLTVPEQNWLDSMLKPFSEASELFTQIMIQLSAFEKVPLDEARKRINEGNVPDKLRDMHSKMMQARVKYSNTQDEINRIYALLILKRTDPDITMSDLTESPKDKEDEAVRSAFVEAIAEFGINERNQWEKPSDTEEDAGSLEKKSSSTSKTKADKGTHGKKSITE